MRCVEPGDFAVEVGEHFALHRIAHLVVGGDRLARLAQAHLRVVHPAQGHVLGHVQDLGLDAADPNVRIYQTRERQTFHTDSCDVVALLCLKTAQSGGLSALVSSTTIFNEMRRRRPDLLQLLFEPIATDRRGEVPEGGKPFFEIPVFTWHRGYLNAIYQRQYIDSAQRFPEAPRLTPAHIEALDLFDSLADDPKLNMLMEFRPGDVQLVHNHTLLHDRTGNYQAAFWIGGMVSLLSAVAIWQAAPRRVRAVAGRVRRVG